MNILRSCFSFCWRYAELKATPLLHQLLKIVKGIADICFFFSWGHQQTCSHCPLWWEKGPWMLNYIFGIWKCHNLYLTGFTEAFFLCISYARICFWVWLVFFSSPDTQQHSHSESAECGQGTKNLEFSNKGKSVNFKYFSN